MKCVLLHQILHTLKAYGGSRDRGRAVECRGGGKREGGRQLHQISSLSFHTLF